MSDKPQDYRQKVDHWIHAYNVRGFTDQESLIGVGEKNSYITLQACTLQLWAKFGCFYLVIALITELLEFWQNLRV